ncbi:hypothetical protein KP509_37G015500 [Ceratopteris richardii]|uniref:GAE domain-containing protein n=1 Tax=Ceratopteris richardii TaxID=49495 RepID=A0A8T2Q6U9_CERRI|nr:hypothetical protein KP509_37G015500 [Ceratopteris richardii]
MVCLSVRFSFDIGSENSIQESFAQVTVWCIGEFGDMLVNHVGELQVEEPITVTESDAVDVVEKVLKDSRVKPETRAIALTSLLKLSSRFPVCTERIKELVSQSKDSFILELQQRAIEFGSILVKHQNIKEVLVERMPVLDEATYIAKKSDEANVGISSNDKTESVSTSSSSKLVPNGHVKPVAAPTAALKDLLDLSAEDIPASKQSADNFLQDLLGLTTMSSDSNNSQAQTSGGADVLFDLLSLGNTTSSSATSVLNLTQSGFPPPQQAPLQPSISSLLDDQPNKHNASVMVNGLLDGETPTVGQPSSDFLGDLFSGSQSIPVTKAEIPQFPTVDVFTSKALKVTFSFTKPPGKPQSTQIDAVYVNLSPNPYANFIFQAAVPKFIQLQLEPASSSVLPPQGEGVITQKIIVHNNMHGQKNLAMKIRIAYKVNNQDALEQGQINNFPAGL